MIESDKLVSTLEVSTVICEWLSLGRSLDMTVSLYTVSVITFTSLSVSIGTYFIVLHPETNKRDQEQKYVFRCVDIYLVASVIGYDGLG